MLEQEGHVLFTTRLPLASSDSFQSRSVLSLESLSRRSSSDSLWAALLRRAQELDGSRLSQKNDTLLHTIGATPGKSHSRDGLHRQSITDQALDLIVPLINPRQDIDTTLFFDDAFENIYVLVLQDSIPKPQAHPSTTTADGVPRGASDRSMNNNSSGSSQPDFDTPRLYQRSCKLSLYSRSMNDLYNQILNSWQNSDEDAEHELATEQHQLRAAIIDPLFENLVPAPGMADSVGGNHSSSFWRSQIASFFSVFRDATAASQTRQGLSSDQTAVTDESASHTTTKFLSNLPLLGTFQHAARLSNKILDTVSKATGLYHWTNGPRLDHGLNSGRRINPTVTAAEQVDDASPHAHDDGRYEPPAAATTDNLRPPAPPITWRKCFTEQFPTFGTFPTKLAFSRDSRDAVVLFPLTDDSMATTDWAIQVYRNLGDTWCSGSSSSSSSSSTAEESGHTKSSVPPVSTTSTMTHHANSGPSLSSAGHSVPTSTTVPQVDSQRRFTFRLPGSLPIHLFSLSATRLYFTRPDDPFAFRATPTLDELERLYQLHHRRLQEVAFWRVRHAHRDVLPLSPIHTGPPLEDHHLYLTTRVVVLQPLSELDYAAAEAAAGEGTGTQQQATIVEKVLTVTLGANMTTLRPYITIFTPTPPVPASPVDGHGHAEVPSDVQTASLSSHEGSSRTNSAEDEAAAIKGEQDLLNDHNASIALADAVDDVMRKSDASAAEDANILVHGKRAPTSGEGHVDDDFTHDDTTRAASGTQTASSDRHSGRKNLHTDGTTKLPRLSSEQQTQDAAVNVQPVTWISAVRFFTPSTPLDRYGLGQHRRRPLLPISVTQALENESSSSGNPSPVTGSPSSPAAATVGNPSQQQASTDPVRTSSHNTDPSIAGISSCSDHDAAGRTGANPSSMNDIHTQQGGAAQEGLAPEEPPLVTSADPLEEDSSLLTAASTTLQYEQNSNKRDNESADSSTNSSSGSSSMNGGSSIAAAAQDQRSWSASSLGPSLPQPSAPMDEGKPTRIPGASSGAGSTTGSSDDIGVLQWFWQILTGQIDLDSMLEEFDGPSSEQQHNDDYPSSSTADYAADDYGYGYGYDSNYEQGEGPDSHRDPSGGSSSSMGSFASGFFSAYYYSDSTSATDATGGNRGASGNSGDSTSASAMQSLLSRIFHHVEMSVAPLTSVNLQRTLLFITSVYPHVSHVLNIPMSFGLPDPSTVSADLTRRPAEPQQQQPAPLRRSSVQTCSSSSPSTTSADYAAAESVVLPRDSTPNTEHETAVTSSNLSNPASLGGGASFPSTSATKKGAETATPHPPTTAPVSTEDETAPAARRTGSSSRTNGRPRQYAGYKGALVFDDLWVDSPTSFQIATAAVRSVKPIDAYLKGVE